MQAKKIKALQEKMQKFGIREEDIEEKFVKASGKGGQKVNKTSSCVYLLHKPTGISVKCSVDRLQAVNRFLARRILLDRIIELKNKELSERKKKIYKIRKQKKKRSKRAKEKILKMKKMISQKKSLRKKIKENEIF